MHRTLKPFELLEPESLEDAVQALVSAGPNAKVFAGGLDLAGKMSRWQIRPSCLVSLSRIPGLDFVRTGSEGELVLGPMATLLSVEMSSMVQTGWPVLHEAVAQIASIQVKQMGTLVGNLCVATPASDIAPALLALGARVAITGRNGASQVPIEEFFLPDCRSVLTPDQLVTEVIVPRQETSSGGAFKKLAHTNACIAKVNVAAIVQRDGEICRRARIALGAVASMPIRAIAAEAIISSGSFSSELVSEAAALAGEASSPISDLRSSAEYRQQMVAVLTRRALLEAWDRAGSSRQAGNARRGGTSGMKKASTGVDEG